MSERIFARGHFLGPYEELARTEVGQSLDRIETTLSDIQKECETRLSNIPTMESSRAMDYVVTYDSERTLETVSTILFDEALWKLWYCYFMLCAGALNLASEYLGAALDTMTNAFVAGKVESEAKKFLENKEIDASKLKKLLPSDYLSELSGIKKELTERPYLIQLATLYGPARLDQIIAGSRKINIAPKLPDGFLPAAEKLAQQVYKVGLVLIFLMNQT
jgi:hypothetical protein